MLNDDNPPYLVFDDLGLGEPLRLQTARDIVRDILERKYAHLCSPEYVKNVLNSFRDDPVRLRASRYVAPLAPVLLPADAKLRKISLIVNILADLTTRKGAAPAKDLTSIIPYRKTSPSTDT